MTVLNNPEFCTLLTAVDQHYLDKLSWTWKTWFLCHPELLNMRVVIMFDRHQVDPTNPIFKQLEHDWESARNFHVRRGRSLAPVGIRERTRLVAWDMPEAESQREKMLTSLVHAPAYIDTPWYLKLDADTYGSEPRGFYYDRWFKTKNAFIANPWGYTKPGTALEQMNSWAKTVPDLAGYKPLEGQVVARGDNPTWKVKHRRMASWVMFGNTEWGHEALRYLDGLKLPFPSQDTYLSYIAELTGSNYVVDKFRRYGWEHIKNFDGLKKACTSVRHRLGDKK